MENNKTEVFLFGGIGNQLFQFFFGQYLSKNHGFKVLYNEAMLETFGKNHGNCLLDFLDIERKTDPPKKFAKLTELKFKITFKLLSIWPGFSKRVGSYIFIKTTSEWNDYATYEDKYRKYVGYFQTYKFFEKIKGKEVFFKSLTLDFSINYQKILNEIKSKNAIGIHLRRGDYLDLTTTYGILDLHFYVTALKELSVDPQSFIFVFTDDVKSAQLFFSELDSQYNFQYINDISAIESLLLLGKCKKICISNSTFGYWGAQLGEPTKVVAPVKWYRNMQDPNDLIPLEWARVESTWQD